MIKTLSASINKKASIPGIKIPPLKAIKVSLPEYLIHSAENKGKLDATEILSCSILEIVISAVI
jgi:hypothetical protein